MTGHHAPDHDNSTGEHDSADEHGSHTEPTVIFFIFTSCALGALIRTVLKKVPLPYTVVVLVLGTCIGALSRHSHAVTKYTTIMDLHPHTILNVFLPVLIFTSAFNMEFHVFRKALPQIVTLAMPGTLLGAFMICLFTMNAFAYDWSWYEGMLFASMISVTDPVSVIETLDEIVSSKHMAIIIEGEALFNDGAAIVLFNVFMYMIVPGSTFSGLDIFLYFVRVIIGGPLFGFFMAKLANLWLVNIFNDGLTEITITLSATYLTFYIGENWLKVSGVLAVMGLGLTIAASRTCISPEVQVFLRRFWAMLDYLANTLIFIIVGLLICDKAADHLELTDFFMALALLPMIIIIRGCVVVVFWPLLANTGYGITWQSAIVIAWSGMRGAVALALALTLYQDENFYDKYLQNKMFLHCANVVFLTLLINGTSVSFLLDILGLKTISKPKKMAMSSAMRGIKDVIQISLNSFKSDKFTADADWKVVQKYIQMTNPYKMEKDEVEQPTPDDMLSCPQCVAEALNEHTDKELAEIQREAQTRMLHVEKKCYWKQYVKGMLSEEGVQRLLDLADKALDNTSPEEHMIHTEDIRKTWKINVVYRWLDKKLDEWKRSRPKVEEIEWPGSSVRRTALKICTWRLFELFLYVIILINVFFVVMEIIVDAKLCTDVKQATYGDMFDILNYIFVIIYFFEAVIKIVGYGAKYFKDGWNIFDFIILIVCVVDLLLGIFSEENSSQCHSSVVVPYFDPTILKLVRIFRISRLLRTLRLLKVIIPRLHQLVIRQINDVIRLGYDVGAGYIRGEEEIMTKMDLITGHKRLADELQRRSTADRLTVMKELEVIQKLHPGVVVSVKTQNAARRVLFEVLTFVKKMKADGILDEVETEKLDMMLEEKIKKLLKIPSSIKPLLPEEILANVPWIGGEEKLLNHILKTAKLISLPTDHEMEVENDPQGGVYVVIAGLIKVDRAVEDFTNNSSWQDTQHEDGRSLDVTQMFSELHVTTDYVSTATLLGEYSLLSKQPAHAKITCCSDVEVYHIDYETMSSALKQFTNIPSLEYKLWRIASMRIALGILRNQKDYQDWSVFRIKMHLQRGVVIVKTWDRLEKEIILEPYTFSLKGVTMADTIVIQGCAQDPQDGNIYKGPCYVPQTTPVLHLLPLTPEKHVLFVISRDPSVLLSDSLVSEGDAPIVKPTFTEGVIAPGTLCPVHALMVGHPLA